MARVSLRCVLFRWLLRFVIEMSVVQGHWTRRKATLVFNGSLSVEEVH